MCRVIFRPYRCRKIFQIPRFGNHEASLPRWAKLVWSARGNAQRQCTILFIYLFVACNRFVCRGVVPCPNHSPPKQAGPRHHENRQAQHATKRGRLRAPSKQAGPRHHQNRQARCGAYSKRVRFGSYRQIAQKLFLGPRRGLFFLVYYKCAEVYSF